MLPDEYRTCQDKVSVKLEVIGGAGVRGWRGGVFSSKFLVVSG